MILRFLLFLVTLLSAALAAGLVTIGTAFIAVPPVGPADVIMTVSLYWAAWWLLTEERQLRGGAR